MEQWFAKVGKSLKAGAEDVVRGVQGKETGRSTVVSVTFTGQALGLTVSDSGGEGVVSALVPDGEAAARGVALGDRVVGVGGVRTGGYRDAVGALRSEARRPLTLALERRVAGPSGGVGLVSFRLDEECDKAERILAKMLASPATGPPRHVLRGARGLCFLRVTKAGFAVSARFGTGCVVARLPGGRGWSAPSAIGTVGASFGLQFGAQVADFLIVLNDTEALAAFSGGGAVSLGGQVGAVAGPVGASREASVSARTDAVAPVYA